LPYLKKVTISDNFLNNEEISVTAEFTKIDIVNEKPNPNE
jgi:hypothetical protein